MQERRGLNALLQLCAGPGRLSQALGIDRSLDGLPLNQPPFELKLPEMQPSVTAGPRIGITKAQDAPWRFGLAGSKFVSRGF